MTKRSSETVSAAGREVEISNPDKVYFPAAGITKRALVGYYLAVAEGALRGVAGRPLVLKRYVDGADQPAFYQKRAPEKRPDFIETTTLAFPSGRTAEEVVVRDAAQLAWVVNLGCIDLHPHPVRADDLDHPDELRIDLDPVPGVEWRDVVRVALVARDVLAEHGLTGWPKTSGSRGFHIWVRIERRWDFSRVRRAALALAREVERRAPDIATSKWWKEERHGVFLDYNQNAKDRTTASAWSVRPTPDARVSMPLAWDEVAGCDPAAFTLATAPARLAERGDPHAGIDAAAGSLEALLALSQRHEAEGLGGDAPWPPHYVKQEGEPDRVMPSRARGARSGTRGGARAIKRKADEASSPDGDKADGDKADGAVADGAVARPKGRRPKLPVITIARAKDKGDALAGLERWKARHPAAAAQLEPADVLVDTMRGRSSTWTRVRVNLQHVPEAERPAEAAPDPDYDVRSEFGFPPPHKPGE